MKLFKKEIVIKQINIDPARRFTPMQYFVAVGALLLCVSAIAYAATITSFSSGQAISSASVNTNFTNLNNDLATLQSQALGVGQTWVNVTSSRISGITYTNNTAKPIQISIILNSSGSNQGSLVINGITVVSQIVGAVNATHQYSFIIPIGNTYLLTLTAGSVNSWLELR